MMDRVRNCVVAALVAVGALAQAPVCHAQAPAPPVGAEHPEEKGSDLSGLAKQLQNPVSNLISVPFQDNLNYGIGPFDRVSNTLNIQPVVPLHATDEWNVITRIIVPIVYQPNIHQPTDGISGLGDINPSLFLAPAHPGALIWGVGPAFLLPTATQTQLGTGKWSIGPTAVVLVQPHPWTIGALANNVWSFAGESGRSSVNQFYGQYFVNYNLPEGWYLTSSPVITANWKATSGNVWTVPVGGGVGKVFRLASQSLNGQVTAFWNAVTPDDGASWQMRLQLAFLFPEETKQPAPAASLR
jgi:hypothetical protein